MVSKTIISFEKCITFMSKYNNNITANTTDNMSFAINIK